MTWIYQVYIYQVYDLYMVYVYYILFCLVYLYIYEIYLVCTWFICFIFNLPVVSADEVGIALLRLFHLRFWAITVKLCQQRASGTNPTHVVNKSTKNRME